MYDKVPNNMNFVEREVQVEKYWKDNDIFGKSIKAREGAPVFTFYDGPPTANGKPHIGHIINRPEACPQRCAVWGIALA